MKKELGNLTAEAARNKVLEFYMSMINSAAMEGQYRIRLSEDNSLSIPHLKILESKGYEIVQECQMIEDSLFKHRYELVTYIDWR